ncbi:MAG TPA: hypothetical protein VHA76_07875 [Solirubrobacterales bacterium]|nr:hypothetical protein [Solirubrobacterales bacterium]
MRAIEADQVLNGFGPFTLRVGVPGLGHHVGHVRSRREQKGYEGPTQRVRRDRLYRLSANLAKLDVGQLHRSRQEAASDVGRVTLGIYAKVIASKTDHGLALDGLVGASNWAATGSEASDEDEAGDPRESLETRKPARGAGFRRSG